MKNFSLSHILKVITILLFFSVSVKNLNAQTLEQKNVTVSIEEMIISDLNACKESIDLRGYKLTLSDCKSIYEGVLKENPNLFYVSSEYKYQFGQYVNYIQPKYIYHKDEIPSKVEDYEAAVAKALLLVDDGMTIQEKLLVIHDFLGSNTSYDYDNYLKGTIPAESYTSYGVLINKKAVCEGYSLAFNDLCERLGIEAIIISSVPMNHAWNMVRIDDNWYHIDVTWDDPMPDKQGRVLHKYFLKSDAEMIENEHYNWDSTAPKATSPKYSNDFWANITTRLIYHDKSWYYTKTISDNNHVINKYSYPNKTEVTVKSFYSKWPVQNAPNSYWSITPMLAAYNNKLYYNINNKIISVNFDGTGAIEIPINVGNEHIYGIAVQENILLYELSKSPNETSTTHQYALQ